MGWQILVWIVGTGAVSATLIAIFGWLILRGTKFVDKYSEEIAKGVARRQNLDRLIEETKKLTDAAETIKAELSHENWDRQTRWTHKKDLYIRLIETMGEHLNHFVTLQALERLRLTRDLTDPNYGPAFQKRREKAEEDSGETTVKLIRAMNIAPLWSGEEALRTLRKLRPRQIRFNTLHCQEDIEHNITTVREVLVEFIEAARTDLGYPKLDSRPETFDFRSHDAFDKRNDQT